MLPVLSRRIRLSTVWRGGRFASGVLGGKDAVSAAAPTSAEIWDWVPPSSQGRPMENAGNYVIPVLKGVRLTADEVRQYLESLGAENPVTIDINGDFAEFQKMVIASGRSARHIRKMTESIIAAMKERRLKHDGIEGDGDDDWQCVNCGNFLVHVMMPKTRKAVDLETHWTMAVRPSIAWSPNERIYEDNFAKLLAKYPVPEDYIEQADISADDPVVKEF